MVYWIAGFFLAVLLALFGFTRWESHSIAKRFPPQGRFAAVPGGRMHYTERLPRGAPRATVLLLHGASGNQADVMLPLGDRLAARGFRVIAIDRPGFGWSDRPEGRSDASPQRQAALVRAAMRDLGIGKAIVLGHSLAGVMAETLALDDPDFVQGLILLSAVSHPWPGGDIAWYYTAAAEPVFGEVLTNLVTLPMGLALIDPTLRVVFEPQAVPDDYAQRTGVALVLRPATFRANAEDVAALYGFVTAQVKRLGGLRAPTEVVTGDQDGVVYTHIHSAGAARDIPDAVLTTLPGIGHSPQWRCPTRWWRPSSGWRCAPAFLSWQTRNAA